MPWKTRILPGALFALIGATGFGFFAYLGVTLTRDETRIAAVWVPNAILVALLIRQDKRWWPTVLLAALAGNITSNLLVGDDVLRSIGLSLANSIEILVILLLLSRFGVPRPDFSSNRDIARFVGIAFASAGLSGIVAIFVLAPQSFREAVGMWWSWARADGLGLMLFVPAITIILDAWPKRHLLTRRNFTEALIIIAVGTSISVATFWQTSYPLLFLDVPIVLLYALRIGTIGNAIALINLAIVASVATSMGHGPINLVEGGIAEWLIVLQVFLASSFAVGLPFAALVTSLKHSEEFARNTAEQLSKAHRTFDALANISPAGIFRADHSGNCIYANAKSLEFVGLSYQEATQGGFGRYLDETDRNRLVGRWREEVLKGHAIEEEVRVSVPGKPDRWIHTLISPEVDDAGGISGFIGIQVDITSRRDFEAELCAARDAAEKASRAKTNFLANMSHEIRTPMNGVLGFADLLLTSDLDDEQRKQVELIDESGRSMLALIDDILDLSKIDADALRIANQAFDVRHTIDGTIALMRAAAIDKGLELTITYADGVPRTAVGDALRIKQILTNLLGNAIKFTEIGMIEVAVEFVGNPGQQCIEIRVADQGIGIAEDRLEAVFEQFTQANDTVAFKFGGSGLGLAISRRLARLMGGDITVSSILGQGSVFHLRLPYREAGEVAPLGAVSEPPRATVASKDQKILVVEDHPINQELISCFVDRIGFACDIAKDGIEAIERVTDRDAKGRYSLVLMDIQMPRCDGLTATRSIREAGFSSAALPIVALTANAFPEDVMACREAGMQDHLAKPIDADKLRKVVLKWSNRRRAERVEVDYTFTADMLARHRDDFEALKSQASLLAKAWLVQDDALRSTKCVPLSETLHKLSGVAALFGEDALGRKARQISKILVAGDTSLEADDIETAVTELVDLVT